VGLDEPDDHVGTSLAPTPSFVQHRERLADARCGSQVDPEPAGWCDDVDDVLGWLSISAPSHVASLPPVQRLTVGLPRSLRQVLSGALAGIGGVAVLSALLVPLRDHLSVATSALVMVVPVVVAVAVGGFGAGLVGVAAGFFAYDFFFIPPFKTLAVGAAQNWVALGVYVVVLVVVSRVVSRQRKASQAARRREEDARELFVLSELLLGDDDLERVLGRAAELLADRLGLRSVVVALPGPEGRLAPVASSGVPLVADDDQSLLELLDEAPGPLPVGPGREVRIVPLVVRDRPLGMLLVSGRVTEPHGARLLETFANQLALAVDRAELRAQAVRSEILERVDEARSTLLGAVSHDLRTPLAGIKAAASTLVEAGPALSEADRSELAATIDAEADRLGRLVRNLLDMGRIESGALALHRERCSLAELLEEAVEHLGSRPAERGVAVVVQATPDGHVAVDQVLLQQVLANLLENALRFAPRGSTVELRAAVSETDAVIEVADAGPGVPPDERERVFELWRSSRGMGKGGGVGLAIAKAFVEAHGGEVRVGEEPGGGACFRVELPGAAAPADQEAVRS